MQRSGPGKFIRFFFATLLIISLMTEPVTAGGGKAGNTMSSSEDETDEGPRPKKLQIAREPEISPDSCAPSGDSDIAELPVCQLFHKARKWDWRFFNWMVLYNLFPQLTAEQYLLATQQGGWRNIENLATALVANLQVSDYNEGLLLVFSALWHSQQATCPYSPGNNLLLQQMFHDLAGFDIVFPQPHHEITLSSIPDENNVHASLPLLSILAGHTSLMCMRLKNSLTDLLTIFEGVLGISLTPGISTKAEERPKLQELISLIPESQQQHALAILIAFPFELYTPGGSASPAMAPENTLREQVAMILAQLWHHHSEYRQQLIFLAVHVIYLNFLDSYPTPDMAAGHQTALQQLVTHSIETNMNVGNIDEETIEQSFITGSLLSH